MVGKLDTQGYDPNEAKRLAEIRDLATREKAIARAARISEAVTISSPFYPDRESARKEGPRATAKRQPKAKARAKARVKAKAKAKAKRKGGTHG